MRNASRALSLTTGNDSTSAETLDEVSREVPGVSASDIEVRMWLGIMSSMLFIKEKG